MGPWPCAAASGGRSVEGVGVERVPSSWRGKLRGCPMRGGTAAPARGQSAGKHAGEGGGRPVSAAQAARLASLACTETVCMAGGVCNRGGLLVMRLGVPGRSVCYLLLLFWLPHLPTRWPHPASTTSLRLHLSCCWLCMHLAPCPAPRGCSAALLPAAAQDEKPLAFFMPAMAVSSSASRSMMPAGAWPPKASAQATRQACTSTCACTARMPAPHGQARRRLPLASSGVGQRPQKHCSVPSAGLPRT